MPKLLNAISVFIYYGQFLKVKKNKVNRCDRGGPTSLDSFAAKLSYNWLVDVMPLVSHILGRNPEYEKDYKPHPVFVH